MGIQLIRKKSTVSQRNSSVSVHVFMRILLAHVVIMYVCSWYVDHKHIQTRLSHRIVKMSDHENKMSGKLHVASLPLDTKQINLRVRLPVHTGAGRSTGNI